MKKSVLLLWVLLPFFLHAQNDQNFEKSFEEFQSSINQTFSTFQDSIHTVFSKALEEQWEEFQVFAKIPIPVKPNPKKPPVADTLKKEPIPVEIPVKEVEPEEKEKPEPQKTKEEEPEPVVPPQPQFTPYNKTIHLWNSTFKIPYDISLENLSLPNTQEKSVAEFWRFLSQTDYQPVIDELFKIQNQCALNSYGLALLCHEYAKSIWGSKPQSSQNESTILFVFLLNQCSLDAKIVRTSNRLEPVLYALQTVYAMSYIEIDRKKYYFLFSAIEPTSIYTYKINFSEQITDLDFNIYKPVNISRVFIDKELLIKKLNKTIKLKYAEDAIVYYKNYPQVSADIYANAAVSDAFKTSAIQEFKPLIEGKTEQEAVSILLNFMHYAFEYKTDEEQYGYEKWNFCEENLFYPYNDCEDRAFLFSWLVRELLQLDVVLLLFSDHLSTAIRFNSPITGSYFTIDGQKYIICDPTYIGAAIGMMPLNYINEEAEIVKTKKL